MALSTDDPTKPTDLTDDPTAQVKKPASPVQNAPVGGMALPQSMAQTPQGPAQVAVANAQTQTADPLAFTLNQPSSAGLTQGGTVGSAAPISGGTSNVGSALGSMFSAPSGTGLTQGGAIGAAAPIAGGQSSALSSMFSAPAGTGLTQGGTVGSAAPNASPQLAALGNAFSPANAPNTAVPQTLPALLAGMQLGGGDANPQQPAPVPQIGVTTAQFDASTPLSGMTEQQKAEYWAGQGVTGLAYGATPTGTAASGGGQVSTYNPAQTASNDAALAAAGKTDPTVAGVQARQAQTATDYSRNTTSENDATQAAYDKQVADALNSQPGLVGSGIPLRNPTDLSHPIDNPIDAAHTAPTADQLGTIVSNTTQNKPIDQGGTATTTYPGSNPSNALTPTDRGGSASTPTNQLSLPASATPVGGPQSATAGPNAGVGLTPTDPNNPLTAQTIAPNSSVDRVKNFQDSLNSTIQNVLDPAFAARSRQIAAQSFGAGRGVSGMNRTSQGNLASDYGNQIKDLTAQGLSTASTGSIEDMYKNLGIAQQQQGFQANQQNNAFGQQAELAQLQDALTNSAFGRSQAQEQAGYANDPSNIGLILSQIFGSQASAAGNAAAGAFGNLGRSSASSSGPSIQDILKYLQGAGGGNSTSNANPQVDDGQ